MKETRKAKRYIRLWFAIGLDIVLIGLLVVATWGKMTAPDWEFSLLHNMIFFIVCAIAIFPICYGFFYILDRMPSKEKI